MQPGLAGIPFREHRVDLPRERITVSRGELCLSSTTQKRREEQEGEKGKLHG